LDNNPFVPAKKHDKNIKLFLWGGPGTGKTTAALHFPSPVLLDMDGGADLYGNKFSFNVFKSAEIIDTKNAIAFLLNNNTNHETLIIDPITVYWESLQKFWNDIFCKRLKGYKANKFEFYELGPKEWSTIKADFRGLFNKLVSLDMNVIVTAREAVKYKAGGFMQADGTRPDCAAVVPYYFDTVLKLYREGDKFFAHCEKDRTENLPLEPFEFNGSMLMEKLGLVQKTVKKERKSDAKN